MIHTSRTVTVGKTESIINEPIVLYRGDREVEVEFAIVGSKFTFTNGGNVIQSTNATHGQLVVDTPTGENMFSEVTECHEGKIIFTITKEMIDELAEVGLYSFQIRLFDESQVSRVTIPPVYQGIEIRHPMAAEDETDLVDIGLVDYSVVRKNDYENVATFLPNGDYNKTNWEEHDVISKDRLNKVEDALYEINKNTEGLYPTFQNQYDEFSAKVNKDVKAYKEEVEDEVEQFERDMTQAFGEFKVDYKDDMYDRMDEVSDQLAHIKNDLVYINSYYYNDLGEAIERILEENQDVKKIILNGIYEVSNTIVIRNKFNIEFVGNAIIKTSKDINTLFNFVECENIKIHDLRFDFENKKCLEVIRLYKCKNFTIKNITIENIYNNVNDNSSMLLHIHCRNAIIDNITFNNIKHYHDPIIAEDGLTSFQAIYSVVDKKYLSHNISNISAYDVYSVDELGVTRVNESSANIIKCQYTLEEGVYSSTYNSQISIKNVKGVNFGKRLIKIQCAGVDVDNVDGISYTGQAYALVGCQHRKCNIRNIRGEGIFTVSLEISNYMCSDLNIENVFFEGELLQNAIPIGAQHADEIKNITIRNVLCKLNKITADKFAVKFSPNSSKDILLENIKIYLNDDYSFGGILDVVSSKLENVVIKDCLFITKSYQILNLYQNSSIDIKLQNCKIDFTYAGNVSDQIRIVNLSKAIGGNFILENCFIKISNIDFPYGHLFIKGLDSFIISNCKINGINNKELGDITSKYVKIKDLIVDDASLIKIKSNETHIENVSEKLYSVNLSKLDTVNKCSVINYPNRVDGDVVSDYEFINSDDIYMTETVKIENGVGEWVVNFPYTLKKYKILSLYALKDDATISIKNPYSWSTLTLIVNVNDRSFTGDVICNAILKR